MDLHQLGEQRSIAYHAVIASRLASDPALVERALAKLERRRTHPDLIRAWRLLLASPAEVLAARLIEDNPSMARLRSVSPFAGELAPRERWRLWHEVRERSA